MGPAADWPMHVLLEELAYNQIPWRASASRSSSPTSTSNFAPEHLKKEILGNIVAGRQPRSRCRSRGRDPMSLAALQAEKVDGGYRINGQKMWDLQRPLLRSHPAGAAPPTAATSIQGITMLSVPTSKPGSRSGPSRPWARRSTMCSSPTPKSGRAAGRRRR